jgi:hypothetical protein
VSIRGTVNALPFHFPEYTILTIQDGAAGAALHTPVASTLLDDFRPGDVVEATGSVITLGGMVMVDAVRATKVSRAAGFQAATATIEDLHRFSAFGKLVRTKGRLVGRGSTTAGPFLLIGSDRISTGFSSPCATSGSTRRCLRCRPGMKSRPSA